VVRTIKEKEGGETGKEDLKGEGRRGSYQGKQKVLNDARNYDVRKKPLPDIFIQSRRRSRVRGKKGDLPFRKGRKREECKMPQQKKKNTKGGREMLNGIPNWGGST